MSTTRVTRLFVQKGTVAPIADYRALSAHEACRAHLGDLLADPAA